MNPLQKFNALMAGEYVTGVFDMVPTQLVQAALQKHLQSEGLFGSGHFSPLIRIDPKYPVEAEKWTQAYRDIGYRVPPNSRFAPFGLLFGSQGGGAAAAAAHLESFLHPLEEVEDISQIQSLPWPDLDDPNIYSHLPAAVAKIHDMGLVAVGRMDCTIFEHSWYLRGMGQLFIDWADECPIADWLLDWFTRRSIKGVEAYVAAGVDVILLGDDVGTQQSLLMSTAMWQQQLQPRLKTVIDAAKNAAVRTGSRAPWIAYHSDGAITPLIPDLIRTGVQILNPMQPECVDTETLFSQYHDQLAFWGGIGTQTTMPFASAAEVRESVASLLNIASRYRARLIPAPTHYLEPDVPLANILAFLDAVRGEN